MNRGFSLIEMIVVLAVVAVLGTMLVLNFRASSTNTAARRQTAFIVTSDIRRMQSMALSGSGSAGIPACGFGIHYADPTTYLIFVHVLGTASCGAKTYEAGDLVMDRTTLQNPSMAFKTAFDDVYFEVPFAKTYLGGSAELEGVVAIEIVVAGQASGTLLSVHQSGRIDVER